MGLACTAAIALDLPCTLMTLCVVTVPQKQTTSSAKIVESSVFPGNHVTADIVNGEKQVCLKRLTCLQRL